MWISEVSGEPNYEEDEQGSEGMLTVDSRKN